MCEREIRVRVERERSKSERGLGEKERRKEKRYGGEGGAMWQAKRGEEFGENPKGNLGRSFTKWH